jgi:ABC-type glycerol-3-phosphate transport system substrate-binding protein
MKDNLLNPGQIQRSPLKIGYFSENAFEHRYAQLISREYPDLRFEIVPLAPLVIGQVSLEEWEKNNKIDLLYIPRDYFLAMINKGMLRNLETILTEDDSFSLDHFIPSTIQLSKIYGQGNLYGIAPSFYGSAIAYNQSLFDQSGVTFPSNNYNWEDLLGLAQRFDHGLTVLSPSPFHWVRDMGWTQRMKIIDESTNQTFFHQPAWRKILELAIDSLRKGHVILESENEFHFKSGEWAMAIVNYEQYKKLEQTTLPFEWSLAGMPTDPANPGQSSHLVADGFWAIPIGSGQPEVAWEVMKFFLSEKVAKWEYRSNYGFSALKNVVSTLQTEQERLSVFYDVQPALPQNESIPDFLPGLTNQFINDLLENKVTFDEGLIQLEESIIESFLHYSN